jgi:hypothetical protein
MLVLIYIFYLLSSIFYLLSSIFYLLSSIFYLLSSIFYRIPLRSENYRDLGYTVLKTCNERAPPSTQCNSSHNIKNAYFYKVGGG